MMFRTSVSCIAAIICSYTALAQESSVTLTAKKDPNGKKNFQDEASFLSPMKTNIPIMMDIMSGNSGSHPAMLEFFDSALATVTSCKYQGLSGNEQAKLGKKYRLDSCTNGYVSNAVVNFNRVKLSVENGGVTSVTLSISPVVKDTVFLKMCRDENGVATAKATIRYIMSRLGEKDCASAQQKIFASTSLTLKPDCGQVSPNRYGVTTGNCPLDGGISDLSPLGDFTHLKEISLQHNQISDLMPLIKLKNLERLNLSWNKISDVTPLVQIPSLQFIFLTENQVEDFSALSALPNLHQLSVSGNPLNREKWKCPVSNRIEGVDPC